VKIEGTAALVTGGASGIGQAFARRLAWRGARVWVVDRDEAAIARANDAWDEADRARPHFLRADVGLEDQASSAVQQAAAESGGLDVLVNSAAVLHDQALVSKLGKTVKKHSLADWDETVRSNLTGTFLMAREAALHMIAAHRHGLIVNVSSISRAGNPGQTAYSATKGAVDALTVTWSQELAIYGIRVVAIAPGFVETPMTRRIPPLFLERIRERTPLKRFGTLDEFGHAIEFIVENDYLNGKVLELDGGLRF
jgi:3-oxoacyl-[acyl-carrier protein] reductase